MRTGVDKQRRVLRQCVCACVCEHGRQVWICHSHFCWGRMCQNYANEEWIWDKELANYSGLEYLASFGRQHGNHVLPPKEGAAASGTAECATLLHSLDEVMSLIWKQTKVKYQLAKNATKNCEIDDCSSKCVVLSLQGETERFLWPTVSSIIMCVMDLSRQWPDRLLGTIAELLRQ